MSVTRYTTWAALSGLGLYIVEVHSNALAHSAGGVLAVIACPGILVVVTNLLTGIPGWILGAAINCAYYEWLWRQIKGNRSTDEKKREPWA